MEGFKWVNDWASEREDFQAEMIFSYLKPGWTNNPLVGRHGGGRR